MVTGSLTGNGPVQSQHFLSQLPSRQVPPPLIPASRPTITISMSEETWMKIIYYLATHPDTQAGVAVVEVLFQDLCRHLGRDPEQVRQEIWDAEHSPLELEISDEELAQMGSCI